MGKLILGYASRDKVIGSVAFAVQAFYARLTEDSVQKLGVRELELELIQYQMTQKPMLRCEVGARSLRASSHA